MYIFWAWIHHDHVVIDPAVQKSTFILKMLHGLILAVEGYKHRRGIGAIKDWGNSDSNLPAIHFEGFDVASCRIPIYRLNDMIVATGTPICGSNRSLE
jgi:hypothetical protein